ncbi:RnfABCDGE type electron transport complex subunit D [Pontibacter harenae]|uniref:RnfABCDGE type electron transport complex subunit D n=1 Tax=Pontibacter harenae TaxID=2894083 RepID=UPI001E51A4C5|nr:RnfABCDGE type electron transport complex subunit D [Pontibacter harenae]MCC9167735.1 RnfABCDGE type electron transport complex subunit D [Pontibacter harenae]
MNSNPYIKPRFNGTQMVMLDVIIALMPLIFVGWLAYGTIMLQQICVAIVTGLVSEFLFSSILLKKYNTILDGSAVVTALLLTLTLSPVTPWYILSFGVFSAILFGKIVWGGLGKNRFNPALVGREFMAVFFASVMTSPNIWKTSDLVQTSAPELFPGIDYPYLSDYLNSVIFKTTGAMGEYSILCIALGGLYLLVRNRISWHIPLSLLGTFTLLVGLSGGDGLRYSLGGILLGTIFMATDMPSSPTTGNGKLYYGLMIGIVIFIFLKGGIQYEYMSYSILLLNGFSDQASVVFRPRTWGETLDYKRKTEEIFILTLKILGVAFAVLSLYYYELVNYLVYLYILYIIIKFNFSFSNKVSNAI